MAATRTLTRDGQHVYLTLASTGGVWECPIDFESEALLEGWVFASGPPGVQVGSAPLTKAQADSLYDPIGTDLAALDSQASAVAGTAGSQFQAVLSTIFARRQMVRDPLYPPADIRWPPPAHPAPPKVTMSAANPATGLTNPTVIPANDSRLLVTGTILKQVGTYWQPSHLSTADSFTIPPFAVEFWTDTDLVRFRFDGFGKSYRLQVDGQWAHGPNETPAFTVTADGGDHDIVVDFATRKVRHLRFEMQCPVKSVIVKADATAWKPKAPRIRAICVGDSFTLDNVTSDNTVSRLTPWPVAFGKLMGWDTWASGVGGSGYLATGGGAVVKFRDRLDADVVAFAPDVVVWAGGHNDDVPTTGQTATDRAIQVANEARSDWDYVAAQLPSVRQIVFSPFSQYGTVSASREAVRAALAAQAASAMLPFVDVLSPNIWTGTGRRGAVVGDGNSDYYVNTDGVHPTPDGLGGGGSYIAIRAAQLLKNLLQGKGA